jgi:MoxR-like ATPase
VSQNDLHTVIDAISKLHVEPSVVQYLVDIVEQTRIHHELRLGVSTRGSLTLLACARAYAAGEGRDFVEPADIKRLALPALAHRVVVSGEAELDGRTTDDIVSEILEQVTVPR